VAGARRQGWSWQQIGDALGITRQSVHAKYVGPLMASTDKRFGMGRIYRDAITQAVVRGDRSVGTEHIALALLVDPESMTARALGISLATAHQALEALDQQALTWLSIDATFPPPVSVPARQRRLRMTPAALAVLTGLRRHAGGERLGRRHILLALLARSRPDPAAELLDALGVDYIEVGRRLRTAS
jgi:ATP-dependent Clp protease ATP-binding subunit ClpA